MRQDRQSTGVSLIVWKIVSFLFHQVLGVSWPMAHKYMWMLAFVSAITSVFPATVESSAHQLNPTEAFCADVFSSYVFSGGLIQNIWMLTWMLTWINMVLCIWVSIVLQVPFILHLFRSLRAKLTLCVCAAGDWEQVIADEACRSYAAVCRQAIDSDLAWQWFEWSLGSLGPKKIPETCYNCTQNQANVCASA